MKKIGQYNGVTVYASANKIRFGTVGAGIPVSEALSLVSKGEARAIRKMLSKAGLHKAAAVPRITNANWGYVTA